MSKPKKDQDATEKENLLDADLQTINEEKPTKKPIYIMTYDKNGKGKQEEYTSPTEEEINPDVKHKHSPPYIT